MTTSNILYYLAIIALGIGLALVEIVTTRKDKDTEEGD
jgi:hypothetical protein